jgi:hypothetical protein
MCCGAMPPPPPVCRQGPKNQDDYLREMMDARPPRPIWQEYPGPFSVAVGALIILAAYLVVTYG